MKKQLAPLKQVTRNVEREIKDARGFVIASVWEEELECGHIVGIKQDIYGKMNAYRRRCSKCLKNT